MNTASDLRLEVQMRVATTIQPMPFSKAKSCCGCSTFAEFLPSQEQESSWEYCNCPNFIYDMRRYSAKERNSYRFPRRAESCRLNCKRLLIAADEEFLVFRLHPATDARVLCAALLSIKFSQIQS